VISHLTERFGTFFIIVLGESLVAVLAGVAGFELTFDAWIVAGLGFLIALCHCGSTPTSPTPRWSGAGRLA
jgi:low temperature requirement protein LtrA